MKSSKLPLTLLATALVTLAVAVAACSGKGSCKNCGVPKGVTNCQVDWANSGSVTGRYDVYLVDLPIADWNSGTKDYNFTPGDQINAVFYKNLLITSNGPGDYASRAMTTSGQFSITVVGTAIGTTVAFNDAGGHQFWNVTGGNQIGVYQGSGGAGQFNGQISDPANIVPGTVSSLVALTYQGTSMSVGALTRYSVCYAKAGSGFAPAGPPLPVGLKPR